MVVLEGGGLLSNAGNQYLQPDYLSPLPTTVSFNKQKKGEMFRFNFVFLFSVGC